MYSLAVPNIGHCVKLTFFEGKLVRFSYVNVLKRELFNLIIIRSFGPFPYRSLLILIALYQVNVKTDSIQNNSILVPN